MPPIPSKTCRVGSAALVLALIAYLLIRPSFEGDSLQLIHEAAQTFRECRDPARWGSCSQAGRFPLYQFLPAFGLAGLGLSEGTVAHLLALLSGACFAFLLWLFGAALRARDSEGGLAAAGRLSILGSFLIRYANSTFGELLAAALLASLATAILTGWRRRGGVAVLSFVCGLTKETAPPFVIALALLCRRVRREEVPGASRLDGLAEILLPTLAAAAANFAFNLFRFGTPWNRLYLDPSLLVHSTRLHISFTVGLWLSPSGGILIFMPALTLLVLVILARKTAIPSPVSRRLLLPGTLGLLLLLSLGFGRFASVFGWSCWGARLFIPWLPAALLVLLRGYSDLLRPALAAWSRRGPWFWPTSLALSALALPQFRVLLDSHWVNWMLEPKEACAAALSFHECLEKSVWPVHWTLLQMYQPGGLWLEWAGAGALSLCYLYGLYSLRTLLLSSGSTGPSSPRSPEPVR